ncbi:MAG: sigma 54-interacting transcriptional regulator [Spirochaetes bacterium]|nr:sigma 54-interacting transcriptional regulator [Spirochaetota bacterium]MBU1081775.1 sigma 54-interacting transcriptional regulator [Spirochaetota bacterium]
MKTVLIVDRHDRDRATAAALLALRYVVRCCSSVPEARSIAVSHRPFAIVLDEESAAADGFDDPAAAAAAIHPRAAAVFASGRAGIAVRRGSAGFYLRKPYRADDLFSAISLASALHKAASPGSAFSSAPAAPASARPLPRRAAARTAHPPLESAERRLIGDCAALRFVAERIALYATTDAPVLILGESGTGKELAALAIHKASSRSRRLFLPVDCAAIPETLAESTLFGTVKGAYTDAVEKKGAFETACGGTVFLDEIGELSIPIQAKFLRTLETESGARVGSIEPIAYDVRILSATNAPLFSDRKRFRPELIHRIDTLVLRMPALREHKDDIEALSESFLSEFGSTKRIASGTVVKLMSWDWPGNVRELRNVIRRASVLSGSRDEILPVDIELSGAGNAWQGTLF